MKDPKRLAFIRTLPCAKCGKHGQSIAHHPTGAGMALKDDDSRAFPLCDGPDSCHASLHNVYQKGPFKDWKKAALKLWQRAMADAYSLPPRDKSDWDDIF